MGKRIYNPDTEIWWWLGGTAVVLGGTYLVLRSRETKAAEAEKKVKPSQEIPSRFGDTKIRDYWWFSDDCTTASPYDSRAAAYRLVNEINTDVGRLQSLEHTKQVLREYFATSGCPVGLPTRFQFPGGEITFDELAQMVWDSRNEPGGLGSGLEIFG